MKNVTFLKRVPSTGNSSFNGTTTTQSGTSAQVAVSILLMLLIILGNSLVILAYHKNHRLRTGTYTFLVSLAISDFLVGSVSLPLWVYGSVVGWRSGRFSANAYIFFIIFDIFSALASTFHLTAVSIERFIAISRPFVYQTLTCRPYIIAITLAWSLAFLLAALNPMILSNVPRPLYFQIYGITVFSFGYLAPLAIISAVNIGIFRIARRIILRSHDRRESRADSVTNVTVNMLQRRIPKERKTAITLMLITGLFFMAWLPFFIVNMLSLYCLQTCFPQDDNFIIMIAELTKWCHYSNSAANAIVYAYRDVEMRRTFMLLLFPCSKCYRAVDPVTFDTNMLRTRHDSSASAAVVPTEKQDNNNCSQT